MHKAPRRASRATATAPGAEYTADSAAAADSAVAADSAAAAPAAAGGQAPAPRRRYSRIAIVLLLLAATIGCSNPFGDDDSNSGTAPEIAGVFFFRYDAGTDEFVATYTFAIGQTAYIDVYASDPDLDMSEIIITQTHLPSGNGDSGTLPLPSQSNENMVYFSDTVVDGPAGQWRIDFVMNDAAGNQSATYSRTITVTE